jgi:hypothetical protein
MVLKKKFAAIYIPPAPCVLKPTKDGIYSTNVGKKKTAFKKDVVLFRRETRSIPASEKELVG